METKNENQEIPSWFATHPLAEAYKQQKAAETLKHRLEAAQRLESILADIRSGFPEEEASLASILHDLKEAERHLTDLRTAAMETGRNLRLLKADSERRRAAVETELYASCDPRLDEAQDFFRGKLDDLRKPGKISTRPMGATRNLLTMTKEVRLESNYNAVAEAMQFCRDAVAQLELMKLIPEFPEAEVEALKEGIPRIDRYVEYCAERSLPKDAPLGAGAPTDYEIQRLLKRRV